MKAILILWAIGLAAADKLDRTYLPPPGSSLAGGASEDLDLPLEVPNENYSSNFRPESHSPDSFKFGYPNLAIGIDRQGPALMSSSSPVITGPIAPNLSPINPFNVPMTTTSYAFTQTTTLSPVEGFETTVAPFTVTPGFPVSTTVLPSDYPEYINHQIFNTKVPQQFNPTIDHDTRTPGSISEFADGESPTNFNNLPQYGYGNIQQNQFPTTEGNLKDVGNGVLAGFNLATSTPDIYSSTFTPSISTQYGGDLDSIPGVTLPSSGSVFPTVYSEQGSPANEPNSYQGDQYSIPQLRGNYVEPQSGYGGPAADRENTRISSTLTPVQYTEGTPGSISSSEVSSTPVYPAFQKNSHSRYNVDVRPERVQSEADRAAVILNYENILTPEGFAYTFDTSNGIHADESGTAVDGVKAQGSYSYIGDDGKVYKVAYTADENGYQPRGDHLPTAPPIPEAILKVIEEAAKNKQLGIMDDGSYDDAKYGHGRYQGLKSRVSQDQRTGEQPYNSKDTFNRKQLSSTSANNGDSNYADSPTEPLLNSMDLDNENSFKTDGRIQLPSKADKQSYDNLSNIGKNQGTNNIIDTPRLTSEKLDESNLDDSSKINSAMYKPYSEASRDQNIRRPSTNLNNGFVKTRKGPANSKLSDYDVEMNVRSTVDKSQPIEEGYEYNKPGTKFISINRNQFPSTFSNVQVETVPDNEKYVDGNSPKPFITPNVSFNLNSEDNSAENSGSESLSPYEKKIVSNYQDSNDNNAPTSYDRNVNLVGNQADRVIGGSKVKSQRPKVSRPYNYQSPYKSNSPVQSEKSYSYPSSTLGKQYSSTTPMPSQFHSKLTPEGKNRFYYPQSTAASMATGPGRLSASSPRPTYFTSPTQQPTTADSSVSNGRPNGIRGGATYQGRPRKPVHVGGGQQIIQEAQPTEGGLNTRFGVSEPTFQSRKYGVQSSTPKIGEDFSGPGKPQQFDPETGYYY